MSKCSYCNKPVETSTRTGKPHKYCGKKCSNDFYKERGKKALKERIDGPTPCKACGKPTERFLSTNKPRKYCSEKCAKDPEWVNRVKKNAWIDENCISKEDLGKQLNVHASTITNRMRKLGLLEDYKVIEGQLTAYVRKIDINPIKNIHADKVVPEGFITREQACELLGLSIQRLETRLKKIKEKLGKEPIQACSRTVYCENRKSASITVMYNKGELMKVLEKNKEISSVCKHCDKEFQTIYETQRYCTKGCSKRAREHRAKARLMEDYVPTVECYEIVSAVDSGATPSPKHFLNQNIENYGFVKKGKKWMIPRSQLDSFIEQFRDDYQSYIDVKQEAKLATKDRQSAKIIRRSSEQNEWEYRERLWFLGSSEKIISCQEKHGIDSEEFQKLLVSINRRTSYLVDYWTTGAIATFDCSGCSELKPFYDFYTSSNTSLRRGLHGVCSSCRVAQSSVRHDPVERKNNWRKNYRARMKRLVAISIKNHVNKLAGEYRNGFGVPAGWRGLEEKCGYNLDDLIIHLEKQFTPNMNWENQSTPKNPGEYGWHLDHIIPHNSFEYDSFDHPDFAKCWALKNLRPMSAIMNMQKGDKDLYQEHYRTFRDGVRSDKEHKYGIWKFLSYTNLEAKKYIEKKFDVEMTWENYGTHWQIDHIDPLAHLAYLGESDENFMKAWDLSNLQPLSQSNNASKSSTYEDQLWIHNLVGGTQECETP